MVKRQPTKKHVNINKQLNYKIHCIILMNFEFIQNFKPRITLDNNPPLFANPRPPLKLDISEPRPPPDLPNIEPIPPPEAIASVKVIMSISESVLFDSPGFPAVSTSVIVNFSFAHVIFARPGTMKEVMRFTCGGFPPF